MKKILITGATGFIGQNLLHKLVELNFSVCIAARSFNPFPINNIHKSFSIDDVGPETNWRDSLDKVDCIIHCAGKSHDMNKRKNSEIYRMVNTEGTKRLAQQAAELGVKRLVFLSSIKVNGESTGKLHKNNTFTYNDTPDPKDAYSISKLEAEKELWKISNTTGLEVVVVRLPLVYGLGAKGNLFRLMKLINSGIPLPFKLINNQRSLIGIDNLIDILVRCIDHPNAKNKTFLVSDGEDISTPNLIRSIAAEMNLPTRLFPFPLILLKLLFFFIGKSREIDRLIESLKVDINYTKETLDWKPPVSVIDSISRMVKSR